MIFIRFARKYIFKKYQKTQVSVVQNEMRAIRFKQIKSYTLLMNYKIKQK